MWQGVVGVEVVVGAAAVEVESPTGWWVLGR